MDPEGATAHQDLDEPLPWEEALERGQRFLQIALPGHQAVLKGAEELDPMRKLLPDVAVPCCVNWPLDPVKETTALLEWAAAALKFRWISTCGLPTLDQETCSSLSPHETFCPLLAPHSPPFSPLPRLALMVSHQRPTPGSQTVVVVATHGRTESYNIHTQTHARALLAPAFL